MADRLHAQIQTAAALLRLVADAGLVGVDEVLFAVLLRRQVGHDDVGAGLDRLFAPLRVERLGRGGGHHVDLGHHQPQGGYHVQSQPHPFLVGGDLLPIGPERGIGVGQEGAQSHHCHVLFLEEEQIMHQMIQRLEGQSHHHAGAGLVAGFQQAVDAGETPLEIVDIILRMDLFVETFVGRLNAQQVAVGARLEPFPVDILALFAAGKRDADAVVREALDLPDEAGDAFGEGAVGAFPALDGHRTVAQLHRQPRAAHHLLVADGVTHDIGVGAAQATVEAVLAANVAQFHQTAQMYVVVQCAELDRQRALAQPLRFRSARVQQAFEIVTVKMALLQDVIERFHRFSHRVVFLCAQASPKTSAVNR